MMKRDISLLLLNTDSLIKELLKLLENNLYYKDNKLVKETIDLIKDLRNKKILDTGNPEMILRDAIIEIEQSRDISAVNAALSKLKIALSFKYAVYFQMRKYELKYDCDVKEEISNDVSFQEAEAMSVRKSSSCKINWEIVNKVALMATIISAVIALLGFLFGLYKD